MLFPLSVMSILTSLAIMLLCCIIMARFRQVFDKIKIPIAILTVLGGLTLYIIGYLPESNTAAADGTDAIRIPTIALKAIFSTIRIFIMESDYAEVNETISNNAFFAFSFSLVHALGAMLTIMTLLSSLGMKFLSRLKLIFARARQVYIFLGFNEASENLIKSIRKGGSSRCCIVVESLQDEEEDASLLMRLREDSFVLIDSVWQELTGLKKLHLPRRLWNNEIHVFALSDEESRNVRVALGLLNQAARDKIGNDKICFYINTTNEGAEKIFEAANRENNTNYEFKIFNLPDLSARQLFDTYPIHDYIPFDTTKAKALSGFTIFLAGLEPTGIEVLRKSIYLGQFIGGNYRAIATDGNMAEKRGYLFNKYPELKNNYEIETYEAIPGSEDFYNVLERNIDDINYIVVAMDNDRRNMELATEIQRLVKRSPNAGDMIIAVHIRKSEDFEYMEKSRLLPDVRFFSRCSDIFTENIIINEAMDRMARKMNALFNSIYNVEPADNWGSLDAFTKESNRSAASNIAAKLRMLGLEMKERSKTGDEGTEPGEKARKSVKLMDYLEGERLDNLAKQEHLRWNAFHFASGWTTWPLDLTGNAVKAKDPVNRRHACLVSWEELEEVTRHFNQSPSYQQLDYEQVKNIAMILDYAGYDVYEG